MPTWTHHKPEAFELLEPGEYSAVITKASSAVVQAGKNAGADKLEIKIRVNDSTTITDNLVFCESMRWKLDQFIAAANLAGEDDTIEVGVSNVVGKKFRVRVTQEEVVKKDGAKMTVNRIDKFVALTPSQVAQAAADEEEGF